MMDVTSMMVGTGHNWTHTQQHEKEQTDDKNL